MNLLSTLACLACTAVAFAPTQTASSSKTALSAARVYTLCKRAVASGRGVAAARWATRSNGQGNKTNGWNERQLAPGTAESGR